MRDMVLGQDAAFSDELFITRINTDLANDLGNAINRVNKFVLNNCNGIMPDGAEGGDEEKELRKTAVKVKENTIELISSMKLSFALEEISTLVRAVNRYLELRAPWKLAKEIGKDGDGTVLGTILLTAGEALRISLALLYPVIPEKALEGLAMLGMEKKPDIESLNWGFLKGGEKLASLPSLFPRIETRDTSQKIKPSDKNKGQPAVDPASKLDFRSVKILGAEDHPDAESLFVLTLDDGTGERTVCAGLKGSYTADELKNRSAVLLANLKPAKLRGIESRGMIMAADTEGDKAVLLDPGEIPHGKTLQFGDIEVTPKSKVGKKDFDKLDLVIKNKCVMYGKQRLSSAGIDVICDVPDGSEVH